MQGHAKIITSVFVVFFVMLYSAQLATSNMLLQHLLVCDYFLLPLHCQRNGVVGFRITTTTNIVATTKTTASNAFSTTAITIFTTTTFLY